MTRVGMPGRRPRRFATQILLLLLPAAVLPLVLLGLAAYSATEKALSQETMGRLSSLAAVRRKGVEALHRRSLESVSALSTRTLLRDLLDRELTASSPENLWALTNDLELLRSEVVDYESVAILSPSLHLVALSGEPLPQAAELTDCSRSGLTRTTAETLLPGGDGKLRLCLASPLVRNGLVQGVILVISTARDLLEFATDTAGLGRTGETTFIRRNADGDPIYLFPLRYLTQGALSIVPARAVSRRSLEGAGTFTQVVDYRGVPTFAATESLAGMGWGLTVKLDRSEALASLPRLVAWILAAIAICAAAMTVGCVLVARSVARPLASLGAAATAISGGDLAHRAEIRGAGELVDLARAFNRMAESLVVANRTLESRVRERTAELQGLYDNAPCGYHSVGADETVVNINATECRWLGYAKEEIIGRSWMALYTSASVERLLKEAVAYRTGKPLAGVEVEFARKDGSPLSVLLNSAPVLDEAGGFVASRTTTFDITELRRTQEERDRYFNASLDLMVIADLDGYFKRLNPQWERTLGWSREELMARPYLDFIHPEDQQATLDAAQGLAEGATVLSFENRYRCKDGSYRWLSWHTPAPAAGASVLYATARDVTEQRLAEERLREANQNLEAFSYSVSHDLRAPLRAIDGFSRLLVEEHASEISEEGRRLLGVVRQNTVRMGQLIDDLLMFSRVGRKELARAPLDMRRQARAAFDELAADANGRSIDFHLGDLPPAVGDAPMLHQVLSNLIGNAIKYTAGRNPAVIEVTGRADAVESEYTVRDNGVGFDMRYAGRLFGVFQRLHSAAEFEGTGVGLALVQRIVARHGGRAWGEGKVGEGACFRFTLPRGEATDA